MSYDIYNLTKLANSFWMYLLIYYWLYIAEII